MEERNNYSLTEVDKSYPLFPNQNHILGDGNLLELPDSMYFHEAHLISMVFYSILMIVSAIGNISVLCYLLRRTRKCQSRINEMLIHLAAADLLVTFVVMPMEIMWAATVVWKAGDIACRVGAFFRTFGLYQSGFVLVCISVDRYFAVLKPMQLSAADRRGKIMVLVAWIWAALCSIPQIFVFKLQRHPNIASYQQCITVNSYSSFAQEVTYSAFGMIMMYALPLIIIIYCYGYILIEIYEKSKESNLETFRRSNHYVLHKARIRTLKMTATIILAFFICWTPYYVMALWYWVDRHTATKVDLRAQRALFLFACTNSSINPIVYGAFNIRRVTKKHQGRGSNTCTTEIRLPHISSLKKYSSQEGETVNNCS